MENKEKNENAPEVKVNKEMIDDFVKEILKLEQENLYIKKHGLKEKIISLVKVRIR